MATTVEIVGGSSFAVNACGWMLRSMLMREATPRQWNALARLRLIFQTVRIEDHLGAAEMRQRDWERFFALAEGNETGWPNEATPDCLFLSLPGGSDGGQFSVFSLAGLPLPHSVPRTADGSRH
jgi:hypothetical protein